MGKVVLVGRLAFKDLRRHLSEAVLLFLVIAATAATLTLGLILHGESTNPYLSTRAATAGPDVVANLTPSFAANGAVSANADPARLAPLEHAQGVTTYSGPYPATFAVLKLRRLTTSALVEGRDPTPARVDQPELTAGSWIRPGGVVLERSFATALGAHVGDRLSLNDEHFLVAGIAVDAAMPPYPFLCGIGCNVIYRDAISQHPVAQYRPGLIWLARPDVERLAASDVGLSFFLNLKLADPNKAAAVAGSYAKARPSGSAMVVITWQQVSAHVAKLVNGPRTVLLVGSGLLVILALASVAVLVGGRLSEQARRVGLLKAVGATPGVVVAVLLVEHLMVTVLAAAIGLGVGRAIAPLLTNPSSGLLGTAGAPPVTIFTVAAVIGVALAISVLATVVPAIQAARISTIAALSDAARPPRRGRLLIAISARLPTPLLLGLRLAARRPRRTALGTLSVAVTVAGVVAILIEHLRLGSPSGVANPQQQKITQVMLVITIMLVVLAAINALLITWATIVDNRHASTLTQALGASPGQVTAGLCATQLLSALPGSILGIPLGIALLQAVVKSSDAYKLTPLWWYPLMILGSCVTLTVLSSIAARVGVNRSLAPTLQVD
ncbi:MAG: FtsX-like permease family protein [Nocardioidaceae bacterium]